MSPSRRRRRPLAAVALLAAAHVASTPVPACAQPRPLETFDVSLSAAVELAGGDLHRFWEPGLGAEIAVRSPVGRGSLEAGLVVLPYDGAAGMDAAGDVPDFLSLFPFLGWGLGSDLPGGFSWRAGARIGSFFMRFDGKGVPIGQESENEFAAALIGGIRHDLARGWFVGADVRHRIVLTRHDLHLTSVSLGIGRSFGTPRWVRDFFD